MKILVAMSGGVDSSVAARLLRDAGHTCIGCTMRLYDNEDAGLPRSHTCCSLSDVEDARQVAYRLGMRYYVFNFTECFREKVIGKFADCYRHGLTPNPCIDCNRYLKFDRLLERAELLGCDRIATGHYARIGRRGERYVLYKAADPAKDQSYVLYSLTQAQLSRILFPLGDMSKPEARELARQSGFGNADKPDSQDICFVPDGNYAAAIERYTGQAPEPGDFVSADGRVLGRHRGLVFYTVGQHKGLGLVSEEKLYVCRLCPEKNQVVLGPADALWGKEARLAEVNWICGETPSAPVSCAVRIRYRQAEQPAMVFPLENGEALVRFDQPQRAITPGQAAVFYQGDEVLGGGVIQP